MVCRELVSVPTKWAEMPAQPPQAPCSKIKGNPKPTQSASRSDIYLPPSWPGQQGDVSTLYLLSAHPNPIRDQENQVIKGLWLDGLFINTFAKQSPLVLSQVLLQGAGIEHGCANTQECQWHGPDSSVPHCPCRSHCNGQGLAQSWPWSRKT